MDKNLGQGAKFEPNKRLGQHFLWQKGTLRPMIEAAELKKTDLVLEIGPGQGILTRELARVAGRVVVVEKDARLIPILKRNLRGLNNIEIIKDDVLKIENWNLIENCKLKIKNYKVVANLPYYIATRIIREFLEAPEPPNLMVVMVQKEVAQRIVARPPRMNLLAASVQFYAEPKIIGYVPKTAFWPKPKVDAAILRIAPLIDTNRQLINADRFFKIVRAGFSQPRKQLINNFSQGLKMPKEKVRNWLLKNRVNPTSRGQELSLAIWLKLAQSVKMKKAKS
jgi:16S rRNA (adenine1518-N6/adenine1519-N6)-dimethyltransferase